MRSRRLNLPTPNVSVWGALFVLSNVKYYYISDCYRWRNSLIQTVQDVALISARFN